MKFSPFPIKFSMCFNMFLKCFCVPMKFSPCYHQVFNVFSTCSSSYLCVPQSVPNSSSLYPKSIALSYTLAIYITSSKDGLQHIHFENVKRLILFFCDAPIKALIFFWWKFATLLLKKRSQHCQVNFVKIFRKS